MSRWEFPRKWEKPSAEALDRMGRELSGVLLNMSEQMAPIFDAADGMKADMEKRGWSPAAAEQVALTWVTHMLGLIFGSDS